MKKVLLNILIVGVAFFVAGCGAYSSPPPGTHRAKIIIKEKKPSSKATHSIEISNIHFDGTFTDKEKTFYLLEGIHSFEFIMATVNYKKGRTYVGSVKSFKLNVQAGKVYTFEVKSDRYAPMKGEMPHMSFIIKKNGKTILSQRMKVMDAETVDRIGTEIMTSIILSAIL